MLSLLLQAKYTGFGEIPDPRTLYITIGVIIGAGVLLYVINRFTGKTRRTSPKSGNKMNKRQFRRMAKKIGLPDTHTKALEKLVKAYTIRNPHTLFNNSTQLDSLLKKGLSDIELQNSSDQQKEADKLVLFQIKQIIERAAQTKGSLSSTRELKNGVPVSISGEEFEQYKTRVVSNLKDGIQVEPPISNDDSIIQIKRWSPVRITLKRDSDSLYSFDSKVLGYKTYGGRMLLLLQHSKDVQQTQQRKFRRKLIEKPAFFTRVSVIQQGSGRKKSKKAVIDKSSRTLGTVIDLSAGGCSIRARVPLKLGELIQVEFETEQKERVVAFGKVKHVSGSRRSGNVMHIMFTRLSRENMNKINYFVYAEE